VRQHAEALLGDAQHLQLGEVRHEDGTDRRHVAKPRKRTTAQAPGRKPAKNVRDDGRIKSTLLLPRDLDFRLTTIAASVNLDRSQLAAQLLDQSLRRYGLDEALRRFAGSESAKATRPPSEGLPVTEIGPESSG
jgi:hypothetical protein